MPNPAYQSRLEFALDAAEQARTLILKYYQNQELAVDSKKDNTPVTEADRGAELLIRELLARSFPDDGILGEEFPETPGKNNFRWILDPIDGTKSFVHGVPLFGCLIGLEEVGEDGERNCVMGVCGFPALDEVVYAAKGSGAWWKIKSADPIPAKVSSVDNLEEACFCTTNVARWEQLGLGKPYHTLCNRVQLTRGWGDCFGHMLVATGRAEIMVDPVLSEWDAAALLPILEEAGGHFIDRDGKASIYSKNGISINAALKDQFLEIMNDR
ncbi:inositol monophosphatase family protein [Rubinisphaera margarita]|uniref:inositol monophosphatase family protein n=1 Tax=Rubinisphaera margarita TaxID=2909586 RepID=UPI001EE7B15C|nr:inositol monophosphatase family protein [Rubinisphaera margarita]MCG6155624.1 inositol monophosphatase family protein [Rubinisphaera margarita]